jgi:hypothetical protein
LENERFCKEEIVNAQVVGFSSADIQKSYYQRFLWENLVIKMLHYIVLVKKILPVKKDDDKRDKCLVS